jgi:broad specificity phosphatase PhoE
MEIYYLRHAESMANIGIEIIDSPLSQKGREQAARLAGHYEHVVISPLRRCMETLHYSKITYDVLDINPNLREWITDSTCSHLMLERPDEELYEDFRKRIDRWEADLEKYRERGWKKLLIIGHCGFYTYWQRILGPGYSSSSMTEDYEPIRNAELVKL